MVTEERKRADARMTVVEHLGELRNRLIICALALLVTTIVAYLFYRPIVDLMTSPLDEGSRIAGIEVKDGLSVPGITTAFLLKIKVSLFAGLLFALPVILFQIWRFITPGLEPREKRFAIPFVAGSVLLFATGAVVAYLTLPGALGFLLRFTEEFNSIIFVNDYIGFVTFLVLAFGITFELPMVLIFLALVGIVSSRTLRKYRRHAIVACFIIAAVATPSQDPYTLVLMALPLYLLYETSLLIIRFGMRK